MSMPSAPLGTRAGPPAQRQRVGADEGLELRFQHRALDDHAAGLLLEIADHLHGKGGAAGEAAFDGLKGTVTYTVSKEGYDSTTDDLSMDDKDKTITVTITEKTGKQFEGIVEEADLTAQLIKDIASSSMEQNVNVQQINESMQSLNKMIQSSTTEVDRIKLGAGSLLNTVDEMNKLISYFTLRK